MVARAKKKRVPTETTPKIKKKTLTASDTVKGLRDHEDLYLWDRGSMRTTAASLLVHINTTASSSGSTTTNGTS